MNNAENEPERDLEDAQNSVPEALIEHAVRCWDAEVESERQLATRMNLLVPGILAVLGLGVFRIGWMADERQMLRPWPLEWVIRLLMPSALVFLFRALWLLLMFRLRARRGRGPSVNLRLPPEILGIQEAASPWKPSGLSLPRPMTRLTSSRGRTISRKRRSTTVSSVFSWRWRS